MGGGNDQSVPGSFSSLIKITQTNTTKKATNILVSIKLLNFFRGTFVWGYMRIV
uniref:Uncharacterized protein n=1 Tax=Arundo donax TaxID=35708 RepID=A0A0A8Z2W5_ARUDO